MSHCNSNRNFRLNLLQQWSYFTDIFNRQTLFSVNIRRYIIKEHMFIMILSLMVNLSIIKFYRSPGITVSGDILLNSNRQRIKGSQTVLILGFRSFIIAFKVLKIVPGNLKIHHLYTNI